MGHKAMVFVGQTFTRILAEAWTMPSAKQAQDVLRDVIIDNVLFASQSQEKVDAAISLQATMLMGWSDNRLDMRNCKEDRAPRLDIRPSKQHESSQTVVAEE